ncbi:microtubule-associated proteins 1A/1B light chain 3C [Lepisosteus oculatus]|uniref:microtubule-associated proteins 1A/1B light chain 3C n=1 Tax=Lepisosteus oculatus TaxID=7918 RepID=UPI0035F50A32
MPPFQQSQELKPFKQRKCPATRAHEVCSIRSRFPNKLPVIVERYAREKTLPLLDKTKFLVPQEMTMGQFVTLLRNRIELQASQAFYLLVAGRTLASLSVTMAEVYACHRDPDGFLYITYASQETFGAPH